MSDKKSPGAERPANAAGVVPSAQMDAVMRLMTGREERTIAEKLADSNRPTWEQYKKDNQDKLNLEGVDQKELEIYRQQLDAERDRRMDGIVDKKKKSKKKRKQRKKHDDSDRSSDSDSSSFDSESSDDRRRRKHKKHKRHKLSKKRNRRDSDDDDRKHRKKSKKKGSKKERNSGEQEGSD